MLEIGACWRVWSTHRRVNPEEVSIRMSPGTPVLLHLLCHCKGLQNEAVDAKFCLCNRIQDASFLDRRVIGEGNCAPCRAIAISPSSFFYCGAQDFFPHQVKGSIAESIMADEGRHETFCFFMHSYRACNLNIMQECHIKKLLQAKKLNVALISHMPQEKSRFFCEGVKFKICQMSYNCKQALQQAWLRFHPKTVGIFIAL